MCDQYRDFKELDDRELLSHLISEDAASYLLKSHNSLEDILLKSYPQELEQVKGIGKKTCARIKATAEIAYRLFYKKVKNKQKINNPDDVFEHCRDMQNLNQEEVRGIYLDVKNQVIKIETISVGSSSSSILGPKEVFSRAIKLNAAAFLLAHNHPSGIPEPSKDDIQITKRLISIGDLLNIQLLDHIIIGEGRYYSLKEHGDV